VAVWPLELKLSGGYSVDKGEEAPEAVKIHDSKSEPAEDSNSTKKKFVTPQISVPVDVLEATTFFQLTDSGVIS
jgi:hypothetical protein